MKTKLTLAALAALTGLVASTNAQLIFSQYAEDGDIKGVEIWNTTASAITFSGSNILSFGVYANGSSTVGSTFNISTGTVGAGDVLVFADGSNNSIWADSSISFTEVNFNFNGDDALALSLDGSILDVIGVIGTDPGVSWLGGGVETRDQNIALIAGITTGDTGGFTDPSVRFETIAGKPLDSASGVNLSGFGVAPVPEPSAYALLAGLSALGFVMLRRRGA